MRVALVCPHFTRSTSLERDSVLLAEGLCAHGVEVHVYTSSADAERMPPIILHHVRAVTASPSSRSRLRHPLERAAFAMAATQAIRRERGRYDIVDVRQTAAFEGDVLQVHGVVVAMQRRWPVEAGQVVRGAMVRAKLAPLLRPQIAVDRATQRLQSRPGRFSRFIAVTEQVRQDLVDVQGITPSKVEVVPPPVDTERLEKALPAGLRCAASIPADCPLALFVGHDFSRKGLDVLLSALAELPQLHIVVVGGGDPRAVASSLQLVADRVHFVGSTRTPERYFAEADLLVLPTRSEPWGIPLIEAMAAGIPVVSTRIAGAASVVESARAGLILDAPDPALLRDALRRLLDDKALRSELGERGRAASAVFGIREHAAAVLEVYERAHPRRH